MLQCRSNLKCLSAAMILIRQLKNLNLTGHSLHWRCIRLRIPLPGKGAYQKSLGKFPHRACLPSRLRPILGSLLEEASSPPLKKIAMQQDPLPVGIPWTHHQRIPRNALVLVIFVGCIPQSWGLSSGIIFTLLLNIDMGRQNDYQ